MNANDTLPAGCFPDGTPIDPWFTDTQPPALEALGRQYVLTDHVQGSGIHTEQIQALIDRIASEGGGVLVVPPGTYTTGALFFRQGVHLCLQKGAVLMGSDAVSDYPVLSTRIEGENCTYFAALINADGLDGFVICGEGTIDGNGRRAWQSFWQRRAWNPQCTNKDEQRARLVFLSHCRNVWVTDVHMQNAQFWTNHLYKCERVKYIGCTITSPDSPVRAPSTDAIDLDACTDVLVSRCTMAVNDDAVVLKGGKGPWADTDPNNGRNERIIVEDCTYGFCHGCLTCGSESVHDRNIIVRRVTVNRAANLLWLKMRPDTPQHYEHILMEDITASVMAFLNIKPWLQFYDLKDRQDVPLSYADSITVRRVNCRCDRFLDVVPNEEQYRLTGFRLEDLSIETLDPGCAPAAIGAELHDVQVRVTTGERIGEGREAGLSGDTPWMN